MQSCTITKHTKTDCFAFNNQGCSALRERYCNYKQCRFYKTKEEFNKSKTPSRLTWEQERFLWDRGITDLKNWLLVDNTKLVMIIYNMKTKEEKVIVKRKGVEL